MPFSDEDRSRIAGMIEAGWSRRRIADVFGMGRNAFIGKFHRDKQLRGIAPPPKPPAKPRERRSSVPSVPILKKHKSAPEVVRKEPPPPVPEMRRVPLFELERGECKWPVEMDSKVPGGHLFCGAATKDLQGWCPYHVFRGYSPARTRGAS